ncbi:MAG: LacI family transcriptional regulator [Lachnospiraceae bacterium]|nr:LacI family transcriptional regulator [Lachnospiraceae bacterium]
MSEKKKPTTRDIAKACFVSQSAVSMILSGRTDMHFSKETIQLVKQTADQMGYVYKPRKKRTLITSENTIMVFCPSLSTQYYTTLIQSITAEAQKRGLYVLTACTNRVKEQEEYYLHMALDCSYFGMIYTYAPRAITFLNRIHKQVPMVLINDYNPDLKMELLELDSMKSGHLLANYLLELGHRHIAYVTTPLNAVEVPRLRRLEGMREAWKEYGLDPASIEIFASQKEEYASDENKYYGTGYRLTMEYIQSMPQDAVTVFVGTNDFIAIGIMDALLKKGYRIPKDFSVCGFDNTLVSSLLGISLTTIEHSIVEKGAHAVSMLCNQKELMKEGTHKSAPRLRVEYEPRLIVRGSTGKINSCI